MLRFVAIFLVVVQLLYSAGHFGIYCVIETAQEKLLDTRLDHDMFAGSEAITLKVPMHLPYIVSPDNYERVDFKLEYDGTKYRAIKQRHINDTLFVVCIKDKLSMTVQDSYCDFIKGIIPGQEKSDSKSLVPQLVKDMERNGVFILTTRSAFSYVDVNFSYQSQLPVLFLAVLTRPPNQV